MLKKSTRPTYLSSSDMVRRVNRTFLDHYGSHENALYEVRIIIAVKGSDSTKADQLRFELS